MPRCFIGFLLPENIKNEVELVQAEVNKFPMICKLVERENLHICLSFLGDVEDLNKIKERIDAIAKEYINFDVSVGGLKAVPSDKYIRVLVLDVVDENCFLKGIQKRINQEIGGDSKPPHITLCRVKNITNKNFVAEKIEEMKNRQGSKFTFGSIQLIESKLIRSGPAYTVIHESKLG
jgi:2'-5' RNA ligase